MTKKYPVVLVEWEDAFGSDDLFEPSNALLRIPFMRRSVGFLIERRPKYILAMTSDDSRDGRMQTPLVIPRGVVKKITRLKEDA